MNGEFSHSPENGEKHEKEASQETVQDLLSSIENIAKKGYHFTEDKEHSRVENFGITVDSEDSEEKSRINLTWYPEGSVETQEGLRILARYTKRLVSRDGRFDAATFYWIIKTKDGVGMEKHSELLDTGGMINSTLNGFDDLENGSKEGMYKFIDELEKLTKARQESHRKERELGLTVVTEEEAKSLLALLEKSQPLNPEFKARFQDN